eukprot:5608221-Karenia_brevis.AAC.1
MPPGESSGPRVDEDQARRAEEFSWPVRVDTDSDKQIKPEEPKGRDFVGHGLHSAKANTPMAG